MSWMHNRRLRQKFKPGKFQPFLDDGKNQKQLAAKKIITRKDKTDKTDIG